MNNNAKLYIFKNVSECIKIKMNQMGDHRTHNIIAYGGLCKVRSNIEEMLNNQIDHVIVYNVREINMLNDMKMNYIIKVKCDTYDIGIKQDDFINLLNNSEHALTYLKGIYISISKKNLIDRFLQDNKTITLSNIHKSIYDEIVKVVNSVYNNNIFLNVIKIDIMNDNNDSNDTWNSYYNQNQNKNRNQIWPSLVNDAVSTNSEHHEILLKTELYRYIKNLNIAYFIIF